MYSRLDPIFKSQMRQAETLDTHHGIHRHLDDESRRRKDSDDTHNSDPALWEDSTTVSIEALRAFLKNLLADSQPDHKTEGPKDSVTKKSDKQPPKSGAAARAASAYQRTYSATHYDDTEHAPLPVEPDDKNTAAIKLEPEERRAMHALIDDLKILAEAGHRNLVIEKNTSFLASLIEAVKKAKAGA